MSIYRVCISYWSVKSNSALMGRSINHFIKLWFIVGSGGLEICVSSTSFQKKWHWLASTASNRKGAKIQYDISWLYPHFFFQNIKIKLNSIPWMTLKSSVGIFQALEPLPPQWPLQPQQLNGKLDQSQVWTLFNISANCWLLRLLIVSNLFISILIYSSN